MPQVPGADLVDTDQAREEKSLDVDDVNDLKDEDAGVETEIDVQGSILMRLILVNGTIDNLMV